jgi:hypothetical protein
VLLTLEEVNLVLIHSLLREINSSLGIFKRLDSVLCRAPFRECHLAARRFGVLVLANNELWAHNQYMHINSNIEHNGLLTGISVMVSHIESI